MMVAKKMLSRRDLLRRKWLREDHFKGLRGPKVEYVGEGDLSEFMLAELVKARVNVVSYLTTSKPEMRIPRIDVRVVDESDLPSNIGERGDYSVMAFCSQRIPRDTVTRLNGRSYMVDEGRLFNLHPSLLPEFKGVADPVRKMIEQGRRHTGVTMHYVDAHLDNGGVIAQRYYMLSSSSVKDKRDSKKHLDERVEKAYVVSTVPSMAQMCKDVIGKLGKLDTINQYHETLIPKKTFFRKE